jgi:hypothetical protein
VKEQSKIVFLVGNTPQGTPQDTPQGTPQDDGARSLLKIALEMHDLGNSGAYTFWRIVPRSPLKINRSFEGTCHL